ncbi:MAG: CoB--CoM heterodisulfide reductase iron-sulfur subunit B family protein [Syntrophorhabdaceae bacterium]|nr:CoB--CoM heterodisulfide reductase iron-sulfur subunit B family protein [Syntrophorhabdaceae bacterium]
MKWQKFSKDLKENQTGMVEKEYGYYAGCSLEGTASEYDTSLRVVLNTLGVKFREPDDWSCCGSTPAHTVDHVLAAALAARNLSIVEKSGLDTIIAPCPSCMTVLKKAQYNMKGSDDFAAKVNQLLDEPYNLGVETKSALQILLEDVGLEAIEKKVTHIFPDLKVAPYYGCILTRPPQLAQFDDPENPVSMDKILSAAKINVCDFAFKLECCGAAFGVPKRDMVNRLTYKVLSMAIDAGANCIAVACPLCQQNLDLRQEQVNRTMGSSFNIPVLYFSQILGLAFGFSPKEVALDKLVVGADNLLKNRLTVEEWEKMREAEAQAKKQKGKKAIEKDEQSTEETE